MSDTERVRAWRQRLKAGGLVPMTIWVPADTKARYEDLALQSHRSVSELAQHALAAYRLDPSLVAAPITDAEGVVSTVARKPPLSVVMAIFGIVCNGLQPADTRPRVPSVIT
jgi:Protein  of unknown function (DUF3018)